MVLNESFWITLIFSKFIKQYILINDDRVFQFEHFKGNLHPRWFIYYK